jgi:hypothetical protein
MYDLTFIMDKWHESAFSNTMENSRGYFKYEQYRISLTPEIKSIFLEADKQEEIKAGIAAFADHLSGEDMSAYAMARSIVETICIVSPPEERANNFFTHTSADRLIYGLDEKEKEEKKTVTKLTGSLDPEPESVIRQRLKPFIKIMRRKITKSERGHRPIAEMQIAASGSGTIKSYQVNPDFLSLELRESIVSAWAYNGFNPYEETDHKEYIYGSTIARISTFTVAFKPVDPTKAEALRDEVRKAIALLAHVRPAFGIPTDHESGAYKRPYAQTVYGKYSNGPWAANEIANQHVFISDGLIKVEAHLDLDDVFNLYYLLENRMVACAQTAQALNNARYVEARSAPMRKFDMDTSYDTTGVDAMSQLGDLNYTPRDELLTRSLESALSLYATKQVDEEQFLREIVGLADHTLSGRLADAYGAFPSHRLLTKLGGESLPVTYEDALRLRAKEFLSLLGGTESETPGVVGTAIIMRAAKIRENVIRDLQQREYDHLKDVFNDKVRGFSADKNFLEDFAREQADQAAALNLSDAIAERAKRYPDSSEAAKKHAVASRANIVIRDSDVEPCLDRVYEDTIYTSRMTGSPWVRKEMPAALKPFLEPAPDPKQALQGLLEFKPGGKRRDFSPMG